MGIISTYKYQPRIPDFYQQRTSPHQTPEEAGPKHDIMQVGDLIAKHQDQRIVRFGVAAATKVAQRIGRFTHRARYNFDPRVMYQRARRAAGSVAVGAVVIAGIGGSLAVEQKSAGNSTIAIGKALSRSGHDADTRHAYDAAARHFEAASTELDIVELSLGVAGAAGAAEGLLLVGGGSRRRRRIEAYTPPDEMESLAIGMHVVVGALGHLGIRPRQQPESIDSMLLLQPPEAVPMLPAAPLE